MKQCIRLEHYLDSNDDADGDEEEVLDLQVDESQPITPLCLFSSPQSTMSLIQVALTGTDDIEDVAGLAGLIPQLELDQIEEQK